MSDYLDSFYTNPTPLTAAGIGIPNGPGANNYFWMVQPRAKFGKGAGQWIEMGADIEAMLELPDGSFLRVYGKAVGSNGTPDVVRVLVRGYADKGVPDAMYGIDAKNARKVEGLLPEGYAEGKGAKPAIPAGRVISDGRKPQKLADIESAPITPDDERMAAQGSNAPEAKGGKDYEASPEGQRVIANLPEDDADVATSEEVSDLLDGAEVTGRPRQIGFNEADRDPRYGKSDLTEHNFPFGEREFTRPGASTKTEEDITRNSVANISRRDGMFEATNYNSGVIKKFETEQEALDWVNNEFNGVNDAENDRQIARKNEERKAAEKADLDARNVAPLKRDEFKNAAIEAAISSASRGGIFDEPDDAEVRRRVDALGDDKALDEAHQSYLDNYRMAYDEDGVVEYDTNNELFSQVMDDYFPEAVGPDEIEKALNEDMDGNVPMLSRDEFGKAAQDRIDEYAAATGETPGPVDPRLMDEQYDYYKDGYARDEELFGNVDRDGQDSLLPDFTDPILNEAFPEIQKRREAEVAARRAIAKAMNGEDPGSLDALIQESDAPKTPKKKAASKKKTKEEDTIDDGLDDFDPEADILEPIDGDDEVGPTRDVDFDPSELTGKRASSDAVPAAGIVEGDVILHNGEPAKVMGIDVGMDDEGGETGDLGFKLRTADGTDYYSDKNELDDVTRLKMEKATDATDAAEPITPEVTPKPEIDEPEIDEPELERIAPETAEMVDPNDVKEGDVLYSDDGTELYGTVVSKTKDGTGLISARVDAGDGSKPSRMSLRGPMLTQKAEAPEPEVISEPEVSTAKPGTSDQIDKLLDLEGQGIDDPELAAELEDVLGRTGNVADLDGDKLDDLIARVEAYVASKPAPEAPKTPKAPSGGKKSGKKKADVKKEEERPEDVPLPPADRVDDGTSDIGWPDDDPNVDPGRPDRLRTDKVLPEFDQFGRPLFLSDSNNAFVLDSNGNPIPVTDEEAFRGLIYEFYPDAKTTADGMRTILKRFKDSNGDTVEISVSRANGGRSLLELRLTSPDGKVERFIHYDDRASFAGLHGKKNSPQMIMDILTGKQTRKFGTFNSAKQTTVRGRLKYFRLQTRKTDKEGKGKISTFATPEETWAAKAEGHAKVINTSKGSEFLRLRQRELPSFWAALDEGVASGDFDNAFFRARKFTGSIPLDLDSLAEFRSWMTGEIQTRYPNMSRGQAANLANTVSKQMRSGVVETGNRRERPFMSADGNTTIETGQWVEYTNSDGVKSYGIVRERNNSNISNPTQVEADFQYRDNVNVEFADGQVVTNLSSKFLRVLDDPNRRKRLKEGPKPPPEGAPAVGTPTKYVPGLTGEKMRSERMAEVLSYRDEDSEDMDEPNLGSEGVSGEDINLPEGDSGGSTTGGPVSELQEGDTFFGKDGTPLGVVVAIQPITSGSGKQGFAILYVDEDGVDRKVNVGADEVRSPKA